MGELRAEARAAWAIARRELTIKLRYRFGIVNDLAQPVYQVLIPGLLLGATFAVGGEVVGLADSAGTTDVAAYLFLGMLALTLASAGFWVVAFGIKMDLDAGTLESAWLTPTRRETYVIGHTIAGVIMALVTTVVLLVVGAILFGASFAPRVGLLVPALAIASIGVLGIGYLVAAIVLRMRDANFFVDAADFVFVTISGAAFPIVVLPDAVRWLAYLLPTTYALDIVRATSIGTRPLLPLPAEWLLLAATSAAFLVVGRWAWLATERRLRMLGTLGEH